MDTRKFTFGYVFLLAGEAVSWKSAKQSVVIPSTTEAEFVACFEAIIQAIWLWKFILGLGIVNSIARPLNMYRDNSTTVFFVEAKLHGESKVIQRCFDDNNDDNKR